MCKIATGDDALAINLTMFIRNWKPVGWVESLHLVMHCPCILTSEVIELKEGNYLCFNKERYKDHFILATKEFFKLKEIKNEDTKKV